MSPVRIFIFAPADETGETHRRLEGAGCRVVLGKAGWHTPHGDNEEEMRVLARDADALGRPFDGPIEGHHPTRPWRFTTMTYTYGCGRPTLGIVRPDESHPQVRGVWVHPAGRGVQTRATPVILKAVRKQAA